jgi:hypothetical protein
MNTIGYMKKSINYFQTLLPMAYIYNHSLTTNTKYILNIRCDISIKGNLELHCDDNSGYKINRTYIHTF